MTTKTRGARQAVRGLVSGRTVAIVGRAASLHGSWNGAAIDACDVVVRVNWMLPPAGDPADVGSRTDILYHALGATHEPRAAKKARIRAIPVDHRLRKRLAKGSNFDWRLHRPTTGTVAVFDALEAGAAEVCVFGVDFYATGYVTATPPKTEAREVTWAWTHNMDQDRALLRELLASDHRFVPDAVLRSAL